MSNQLTAEPGTIEFLRQLLEIASGSDHPVDKALTIILSRKIGEALMATRQGDGPGEAEEGGA